MIKLTALNYNIKVSALERAHKINDIGEAQMFKWERDLEEANNLSVDYPEKPFIEPHEFQKSDYDIIELPFRVQSDDVYFYRENLDGETEVGIRGTEIAFIVKESVEYLDKFFGI